MQRDIPFARIALQKEPDAINLWIGNTRSVTALHRDNYENVYVQVAGRKRFVLLPPLCQPCVAERDLPPAHYTRRRRCRGATTAGRNPDDDENDDDDDDDKDLVLVMEDDEGGAAAAAAVPFATWDPDDPDARATPYSALARPMRVTLDPGDMLYLPAMWYVWHIPTVGLWDDGLTPSSLGGENKKQVPQSITNMLGGGHMRSRQLLVNPSRRT